MNNSPAIYVASLSDYNEGTLHGEWIDATLDAEDIQAEIAEMLEASTIPTAEEWAIHDHEGFPVKLGEWESAEWISALGQAIEWHGADIVEAAVDHLGVDTPDDLRAAVNDCAAHQSWDAAVESYAESCGLYELAAVHHGLIVHEEGIRVMLEANGTYHENRGGSVVEFFG